MTIPIKHSISLLTVFLVLFYPTAVLSNSSQALNQESQDLRNCHKQWRGVTAPRPKRLGDKHGNIRTF